LVKKNLIKDVVGLLPTPLLDDGDIDEKGLRNLVDYDMDHGCHGVGVLAAIGEGYLLSQEKRTKVISIAVDQLKGRGPLIVGIAAMGTEDAIDQAKIAEKAGASSLLAFNPQGIRPYSSRELIIHYEELVKQTSLEVLPYSRKTDPIPFEVLKHLVDKKLIFSMKYAWLNCDLLVKMKEVFPEDMLIMCGADEFTLRYIMIGCKGISTATAGILPKENVKLLELVRQNKIDEARSFYKETIMPWNDIGFYSNWQAVHKLAFKLMGLIQTDKVLLPQHEAFPHQIEEVKWFVKNYK